MTWDQLRGIVAKNLEFRREELSRPPLACPNDGTPLVPSPPGSDSTLFCPFDGWAYPRDDHRPVM